ncbi:MAG TPA: RNA-guided endonuclease IscB [Ktedonobacteraceae bacterium]|nr:RNA-guided endonuclease IscB [Ktedonobacteraceae bacterium]
MSNVFVVDTNRTPLDPVHPGYARILLSSGKAAVLKRYPFTIVLKTAIAQPQVQPLRIKLDPGSKTTGLAIVNDASGDVVFAAEITHQGQTIKAALDDRRAVRRSRRRRKTRYRKPRFANRRRKVGWIPPSLASRVVNTVTWVQRLCKLCSLTNISIELVKFDLQQMDHPEINGTEYQQGTLAGYEVREYLLQKWNRQCSYCGAKDIPLQVEHIHARANGGTNRVSNLALACEPCNQAKGTLDIHVFLASKPDLLKHILAQAKAPLKDAAAVNTTRWMLYDQLKTLDFPIECGSGGLTKLNRTAREMPKEHWIDAVCVGKSTPIQISMKQVRPLLIRATGHGSRQMCGTNTYGFPIRHKHRQKRYNGFQTGDMVRAVVPLGKKQGIHIGRVLVRATGSFDIRTKQERVQGISHRYCTPLYRCDGYSYQIGEAAIPHHE